MPTLYIIGNCTYGTSDEWLEVDLETLVVLNIFHLLNDEGSHLKIVSQEYKNGNISVNLSQLAGKFEFVSWDQVPDPVRYLKFPAIQVNNIVAIAGICSVARHLIKLANSVMYKFLLGFRESCLATCSEFSIWTKFCEIDIIKTVERLLNTEFFENFPEDILKLEHYLRQPVKVHNVYKLAREKDNNKSIKSSVPVKELNVPHCYTEGPFVTLADVVLLPSFDIIFQIFSLQYLKSHLPLLSAWYEKMKAYPGYLFKYELSCDAMTRIDPNVINSLDFSLDRFHINSPNFGKESRIFTKQSDVENSIKLVKEKVEIVPANLDSLDDDEEFNWDRIPLEAGLGTAFPSKRFTRKRQQLENMTRAVMKLAKLHRHSNIEEPIRIVDFCAGSGYLGILLAVVLPHCKILLVENKEQSLKRASERIKDLSLVNVTVLQSNLDYFRGSFDIGVSLHACGLATDLVIQNCIDNRANFVCCPCCYGGIHDSYHISFPRSVEFREILSNQDYLYIAHAADQTHDSKNAKTSQGYDCMNIIDVDRKLHSASYNYDVSLSKLFPENCTPKNNLIVGIYKGLY